MPYLNWTDALSVNVVEIDTQHKRLVALINRLYDAIMAHNASEIISSIIREMAEYAAVHFATEEQYMDLYGYPEKSLHKSMHRTFIAKTQNFEKQLEVEKIALSLEVVRYLRDWIAHHIAVADKAYTAFFNSKGLY